ncbi:MAG: VanZ family protein [Planctomycetes bacterium]|nr:VanZ family protein [Planctomycetota bacterium]
MVKIIYYQFKYWLPVYVYAFAIFLSSHQARLEMPIRIIGIDKIVHFIAYGVLAGLTYRACRKSQKMVVFRKAYFISMVCSILYGFSDEFHQFYIPGRQTSEWDFIADALGAIVAIVIILKFTSGRIKQSIL